MEFKNRHRGIILILLINMYLHVNGDICCQVEGGKCCQKKEQDHIIPKKKEEKFAFYKNKKNKILVHNRVDSDEKNIENYIKNKMNQEEQVEEQVEDQGNEEENQNNNGGGKGGEGEGEEENQGEGEEQDNREKDLNNNKEGNQDNEQEQGDGEEQYQNNNEKGEGKENQNNNEGQNNNGEGEGEVNEQLEYQQGKQDYNNNGEGEEEEEQEEEYEEVFAYEIPLDDNDKKYSGKISFKYSNKGNISLNIYIHEICIKKNISEKKLVYSGTAEGVEIRGKNIDEKKSILANFLNYCNHNFDKNQQGENIGFNFHNINTNTDLYFTFQQL